ncbi:MAG: DUF3606 domain-containing protein [Bacteroidota bacterium]
MLKIILRKRIILSSFSPTMRYNNMTNIGWYNFLTVYENISMSDNKSNISQQDRIRVDANDPNEVEYLHEQFPDYTHSEILEAIKENGPFRENVTAYLKSHKTENKRNS